MSMIELRREYHKQICEKIIRITRSKKCGDYPNFCDGSSKASVKIAYGILEQLKYVPAGEPVFEQTVGDLFEAATKEFLSKAFALLQHVRPGNWIYSTEQTDISRFDQYEHLAYLAKLITTDKTLAPALGGDYIVTPDIIVARIPITDAEINQKGAIINEGEVANLTPLRMINREPGFPILHASISCKWTIRSDRSQNTRTEALNLIRNRKGNLPHVVAVTAEPLPTRIASLALGTGDLDCVYHFALNELMGTIQSIENEDQMDMLKTMVEGRRLRDISDLPFDLAV
jgi:hypothetical protein